jgi:excisionase family DNA binding protein
VKSPSPSGSAPAPLLTIRDVVAYTRVSEKTVRRAVRDGKLRAFRLPGGLRFRLQDVETWVDSFAVQPDPAPERGRRPMLSEMLA